MVKILANGDIVQDNDPRVQQSRHSGNASSNQGSRMGYIRGENAQPNQYGHNGQGADGHRGHISIFQTFNQRLLDWGIPRFNLGPYPIEPIVTVGFVLAGLLFGLPGLLFAALLFGVVMMSGSVGGGGGNRSDRGGNSGGGDRSGHRSGRVLRHR